MSDNLADMAYCVRLIDRLTRVQEYALNKSISLHNAPELINFEHMLKAENGPCGPMTDFEFPTSPKN
jgi:hypothetical protein